MRREGINEIKLSQTIECNKPRREKDEDNDDDDNGGGEGVNNNFRRGKCRVFRANLRVH